MAPEAGGMAATDPVEWEDIDRVRKHTSHQCEAVFEAHREEIPADATLEGAVALLYEAWHEEYDTGPDQGGAYIFAYLVEKHGLAEPVDEPAVAPASLVERKPDAGTLRRLFWEDEQVPWWIAVRLGVHYNLVQFWLREEDIPVMRRNVPDEYLEEIDRLR